MTKQNKNYLFEHLHLYPSVLIRLYSIVKFALSEIATLGPIGKPYQDRVRSGIIF